MTSSAKGPRRHVPYAFSFATADNVSPTIAFDPPPAPSFYTLTNQTLGLAWTANDIQSIQIKVNGSNGLTLYPRASDRHATFTDYVADSASPRVYAATPTDFSGNVGPAARPVIVAADRVPPGHLGDDARAGGLLTGRSPYPTIAV